jgi:hypothetical protein
VLILTFFNIWNCHIYVDICLLHSNLLRVNTIFWDKMARFQNIWCKLIKGTCRKLRIPYCTLMTQIINKCLHIYGSSKCWKMLKLTQKTNLHIFQKSAFSRRLLANCCLLWKYQRPFLINCYSFVRLKVPATISNKLLLICEVESTSDHF